MGLGLMLRWLSILRKSKSGSTLLLDREAVDLDRTMMTTTMRPMTTLPKKNLSEALLAVEVGVEGVEEGEGEAAIRPALAEQQAACKSSFPPLWALLWSRDTRIWASRLA